MDGCNSGNGGNEQTPKTSNKHASDVKNGQTEHLNNERTANVDNEQTLNSTIGQKSDENNGQTAYVNNEQTQDVGSEQTKKINSGETANIVNEQSSNINNGQMNTLNNGQTLNLYGDKEKLLSYLRKTGWHDSYLPQMKPMLDLLDGSEIASAIIEYWKNDLSLGGFAQQLNDVSGIFTREKQKLDFIAAMNLEYFEEKKDPPDTATECYIELLFWDGCDMLEARAYFESIGMRFAELSGKLGAVGPELAEMLETRKLSLEMKEVRRSSVETLKENIRGKLAMERIPAERLNTVLSIATGVGGARIIDNSLWSIAEQSALQGANASSESYIEMRNRINQAADAQILDQPRETLNKITNLLRKLDQKAECGIHFEPAKMLQYWRSVRFRDIPDNELLQLYQKYLQKNPNGLPLLRQDRALLTDRNDERIFALLGSDSPAMNFDSTRMSDGYLDRETKRPTDRKKILYIALGVLVVILLAMLAMMLPKGGGEEDETPKPSETPTPSATQEQTPAPTPEETQEPESEEEEEQEERTEEPEETKEESTPEPSPSPTETPAESPSEAPTPSATPGRQEETPQPSDSVDEPENSEPVIDDTEEVIELEDINAVSLPMEEGIMEEVP